MEWYWWVLIVVGAIAFAVVKVKVGGAFLRRLERDRAAARRRQEDDD